MHRKRGRRRRYNILGCRTRAINRLFVNAAVEGKDVFVRQESELWANSSETELEKNIDKKPLEKILDQSFIPDYRFNCTPFGRRYPNTR